MKNMFWKIGGKIVKRRKAARRLDIHRVNLAEGRRKAQLIKPVRFNSQPLPMP